MIKVKPETRRNLCLLIVLAVWIACCLAAVSYDYYHPLP